jgi:hypothetical protein
LKKVIFTRKNPEGNYLPGFMFSALNGILARFSGNQISYLNISFSDPAGMNFFSHPDFTVGTGIPIL